MKLLNRNNKSMIIRRQSWQETLLSSVSPLDPGKAMRDSVIPGVPSEVDR
ncbi:MAG: hypothetical protein HQ555_09595 [Candidatus Aminicenantes bacterium]|nr:hypothetical protein [Candidatus Aminicenantes bacterium]